MGLFLIESMGKKVHLLDGLFNRLDEMAFLTPGIFGFRSAKKDRMISSIWEEEAFEFLRRLSRSKIGPLGIGEEIAGNQNLVDHPGLCVDGDGDPDQSSRGLQDGGQGFSSSARIPDS